MQFFFLSTIPYKAVNISIITILFKFTIIQRVSISKSNQKFLEGKVILIRSSILKMKLTTKCLREK